MHIPSSLKTLGFVVALALVAGCTEHQSVARPIIHHASHSIVNSVPTYSCPATGTIVYVSDNADDVINVYSGRFSGQGPCGQIGAGHLRLPAGVFVDTATHDLYVANAFDFSVTVFHRGQKNPFNTYIDPGGQVVNDVTVAGDGTVIASNTKQYGGPEAGSLSTWIAGPNGGTFVGNFPMTKDSQGGFLTLKKNGTVYFNDIDVNSGAGALWKVSCPLGVCGPQTRVKGVSFASPSGMAFDATGDLLANDRTAGMADTFELPNPTPEAFPLLAGGGVGMAIDDKDKHWFAADPVDNQAAEYLYPSGALAGVVPGNQGGWPIGVAVDP
jgi:DNA-binding beta-propeller fold protein YncE